MKYYYSLLLSFALIGATAVIFNHISPWVALLMLASAGGILCKIIFNQINKHTKQK